MIKAEFVEQAFMGGTVVLGERSVHFRTEIVGELEIISGQITACDPFVDTATRPFTQRVPLGNFPLRLAIAEIDNEVERVAFARIDFANMPVASWKIGVVLGNEVTDLEDIEALGYPVDSGVGCFMDTSVAVKLDKRFYEEQAYFDEILAACKTENEHPWTVVDVHPEMQERGNMITFTSGWGDGVYASYFGYSAQGVLQCLVTDFEIVFEESEEERTKAEEEYIRKNRAKPWWQFW